MPLILNSTEVGAVKYNGSDVDTLVYNGVTVFEAAAAVVVTFNRSEYDTVTCTASSTTYHAGLLGVPLITSGTNGSVAGDVWGNAVMQFVLSNASYDPPYGFSNPAKQLSVAIAGGSLPQNFFNELEIPGRGIFQSSQATRSVVDMGTVENPVPSTMWGWEGLNVAFPANGAVWTCYFR